MLATDPNAHTDGTLARICAVIMISSVSIATAAVKTEALCEFQKKIDVI